MESCHREEGCNMSAIRWSGLAAFTVIFAIIFALFYVFSGPVAKWVIESKGGDYTGAEVNVAKVDVQLMPLSLTLYDFQATDPKLPTNNMVAFGQATASLSLWHYLLGKTIVDDLVVDKLTLSSKRKSPGAVYRDVNADQSYLEALSDDYISSIESKLPNPEELLDNANLKTVKRAKALEQSYQQQSEKLKTLKQQVPSKEELKAYQDKVKALTKIKVKTIADVERIKREFDALKKNFKADKEKLSKAKEELVASKKLLTQQLTDLKNAPQEDWQDIQKTYQLESFETEDLAHMLFGEEARKYYQFAEVLMETLKPFLAGSENAENIEQQISGGRFIHFDEENALPAFWLKNGKVSVSLPQGDYQIILKDITHQHWLINKQSTLAVTTTQQNQAGDITLNSAMSIAQDQNITADGQWDLTNLALSDMNLSDNESLSLSLVKAVLAGKGSFDIKKGLLDLDSSFSLDNSQFSGDANSKMAKILVDALAGVDHLNFDVDASGDVLSPTWSVDSSLNNLLSSALTQQVSGKLAEYQANFQSGLGEKSKQALSLGDSQQSELLDIEALFSDSDNALDSLLKNDIVKQKQKELENKAKDKLKEKLGKLFG